MSRCTITHSAIETKQTKKVVKVEVRRAVGPNLKKESGQYSGVFVK